MGAVKAMALEQAEAGTQSVPCPTCGGSGRVWYRAHRTVRYAWPDEPDGLRTRIDKRPTKQPCGLCGGAGYLTNTPFGGGEEPMPF